MTPEELTRLLETETFTTSLDEQVEGRLLALGRQGVDVLGVEGFSKMLLQFARPHEAALRASLPPDAPIIRLLDEHTDDSPVRPTE